MSTIRVCVYESDGSDGYGEGTWGYTVMYELDGREVTFCDGGFPSREDADSSARESAKAAR